MKKMKIIIRKDGTQTIEVLGATGEECVEFTRQLEQRLGTQDGERVLKPEYSETEAEPEKEPERES
ncbi:MAG: DUF2997 domain-containing protein [Deltaproteobacteria bacterium]|nr:DUF2997 domain-containing protein [Deltaproteobacteria bacterium]